MATRSGTRENPVAGVVHERPAVVDIGVLQLGRLVRPRWRCARLVRAEAAGGRAVAAPAAVHRGRLAAEVGLVGLQVLLGFRVGDPFSLEIFRGCLLFIKWGVGVIVA